GRAASTDGGAAIQSLTSTAICRNRSLLRLHLKGSRSTDGAGAQNTCPVTSFGGPVPAPRLLRSHRAYHHRARQRQLTPSDGRPSRFPHPACAKPAPSPSAEVRANNPDRKSTR